MKRVRHVLFITKEFQSEFQKKSGGTGVFYKNMSEELIKQNIQVSVFGSSKIPFSIEKDLFSLVFVKDYFQKYKIMEFVRSISGKFTFLERWHYKIYDLEIKYLEKELTKFIFEKKIDIVETHDWEGLAQITQNLKIPYVIRCHGSWSVLKKFFGYGAAKGKIHNEIKAFKNASNIITVSNENTKMVQETFEIKKFHLIYNGIDTNFYKPQHKIAVQKKAIFYVGNISAEKGAETALDTFIRIYSKEKEATLHFVGKETPLADTLKKKVNINQLEQSVFFHGKKKPHELVQLVSKAEVMIFPSKGETFGLALIEAMAMEKPIVCSNLPVFNEIIVDGKNGFIAKSVEEFSDRILELFDNNQLATELGIKARERVLERFSLTQTVYKSLDFYNEIINNNS